MESRTYSVSVENRELKLTTGSPPNLTVNDQPLQNEEGKPLLRGPDVMVLQYIVITAAVDPNHVFTAEELWRVGWPNSQRPELLSKPERDRLANRVSGSMSRLRANIKGLLEKDSYRLVRGLAVSDATPTAPPLRDIHRVVIAIAIAVFWTVLIDTPVRALLEAFHLTIAQPTDLSWALSFLLGLFQGLIGSLLWSIGIGGAVLYRWIVAERLDPWQGRWPILRSAAIGSVAGAAAGGVISIALLFAQRFNSLQLEGWLPAGAADRWPAFTQTGLGYAMPWFGAFIGLSCASLTMWITGQPAWKRLIRNHSKLTNPQIALRTLSAIARLAVSWSVVFLVPPMLLSAVAFWLLWHRQTHLSQLLGESLVIAIGGAAFVTGLLVGLFSLAKGVDVVADPRCSLIP